MVSENNKRIAKNTLILYFRMMFTMFLSFFTTRLLLQSLGVVNFGLAEVIAGVVSMLSFLSGTLSTASSRFFNFELGKGNFRGLKDVFSQTFLIYLFLALVILLFSETLGLWVLSTKIVIPIDRVAAAHFFFQVSIFSFLMNILSIPFNAIIIAHENMKAYSWISIGEAVLKCLGAYCITLLHYDVLKVYGLLLLLVSGLKIISYLIYCRNKYTECRFSLKFHENRIKELLSFAGWNLIGALSPIINGAILNIVLNNMFGLVVNAARAISNQVTSGISGFTTNFLIATNPQITKYYARNELNQMHALIRNAIRLGFLLMFWISIPVLIETTFILNIWLKNVPEYAVLFVRLAVLVGLLETFYPPLATGVQATGRISLYQGVLGTWYCLGAPLAILFFWLGKGAEYTFIALMIISFGGVFIRGYFLRKYTAFSIKPLVSEFFKPMFIIVPLSYLPPLILEHFMEGGWLRFVLIITTSLIWTGLVIFIFGLKLGERSLLKEKIRSKLQHRKH